MVLLRTKLELAPRDVQDAHGAEVLLGDFGCLAFVEIVLGTMR